MVVSKKAYEEKARQTMYHAIMSDIEQNIFRSKLRNPDCNEPIRYLMFFNTDEFKPMIELMQERYKGANVFVADTPTSFLMEKIKIRNSKVETQTQRIIDWLYSLPKGKTFKTCEMLRELELSQKQFDKIKEKNPSFQKIFKSMKTDKHGIYQVK